MNQSNICFLETWLLGQSMVLIEDNKQAGWVGTITDITEEQRAEEALELANKTKSAFLAVMYLWQFNTVLITSQVPRNPHAIARYIGNA